MHAAVQTRRIFNQRFPSCKQKQCAWNTKWTSTSNKALLALERKHFTCLLTCLLAYLFTYLLTYMLAYLLGNAI